VIHSTDDLIEQLTGMQPRSNQASYRTLLQTIVLQAKAEGRLEAVRTMNASLTQALSGSLH
jgi:hypothetical protein